MSSMDLPINFTQDTSTVVELRRYTMKPGGGRDALIALFDRHFLESQDEVGGRVLGQFRQPNAEDQFVWLRGFKDMETRRRALETFYGGPVWKTHRAAANATMIDSDNVLLLRPVSPAHGFVLPSLRPREDAPGVVSPAGIVMATIYLLAATEGDQFVRFFEERVKPLLIESGARPIATFRTEPAENNFPALPVRTGVNAFVWFTSFASAADHQRHVAMLNRSPAWQALSKKPAEQLLLEPTGRSLLRHYDRGGFTMERKGGLHDFDFLAGNWSVLTRRLKTRGAGAQDWAEARGVSRMHIYLGGAANVQEVEFPSLGWSAIAPRFFNIEKQQWSIYWALSRQGVLLMPPVVGGFIGDRGEMYGEDQDDGRPVKTRFIWSRLGPEAARWEQAFDYGDGNWETNWIMEFTRAR
jgi:hypothetical protein